ncbi:MAG: hypothetical protein M0R37_12625 [Bacteroidales bacterium]|nr:hypothetical protein [Bacteroidales bacterium]
MNHAERDVVLKCYDHYREDLERTKNDLVLHVSPTGDDQNGKGTLAAPYLTKERVERRIAESVAHNVQVRILGSLTTAERWGSLKQHRFLGAGSIQIYGVGAPEVKAVHGGPHAVTAASAVGFSYQKITIGAGGLTAKEFRGWFVRVLAAGGNPGYTFRVIDNATDTIWIEADPFGGGVTNGDTLEIIRPSVSVTLDGADIDYDSDSDYFDAVTHGQCHEVISNLRLLASGSTTGRVRLHGTPDQYDSLNLDFVVIESSAAGVAVQNVSINQTQCIAQDYVVEGGTGIANLGTPAQVGLIVTTPLVRDGAIYTSGDVRISGTSCTGTVVSSSGSLVFDGSATQLQLVSDGGSASAMTIGAQPGDEAVTVTRGSWDVLEYSIGVCAYALGARGGSTVRLGATSTCDAAGTTDSALFWGRGSHVFTNDDCAGFKGATAGQAAYIAEMDPAVKSDAWPAAGGYVTDALGADLLRCA